MRILIALFILSFSASAQEYRITGRVDGYPENRWIYLIYKYQNKRCIDSSQVKQGRFMFLGKIDYPVDARICDSPSEWYQGENSFSFMLEPASFSISSEGRLVECEVKGSQLNEEKKELLRMIAKTYFLNRNYRKYFLDSYRSESSDSTLATKKEISESELSDAIDSTCIEFARNRPESYLAAIVMANVISTTESNSTSYRSAREVFEKIDERWKSAPAIVEILHTRRSKARFHAGSGFD